MNLPVEWLNSYLQTPLTAHQLAAALERAGVEVDAVAGAQALDSRIVVGRVTQLEAHPDATKLRVAQVEVGEATLQIVCGAANLEVGQIVPVALEGALLPDGTKISHARLRGTTSQGMICSRGELGLPNDEPGIMILNTKAAAGTPVSTVVTESDVIATTTAANRWDLNGMVWLAHEVAAQSGHNLRAESHEHNSDSMPPIGAASDIATRIESPELVGRYLLVRLRLDQSQPSPPWLVRRLQAVGIRPINPVVDVTNYVMVEYGQPLHAFDAAKVTLPVGVRTANPGEQLVTLDGTARQLDPADLLITDAKGPIGLAGVMGGRTSEVDAVTTEIYLESASFNGSALRKTALRHGLRTEASARFERRLPVDLAPVALRRAITLLAEIAAAEVVAGPADHLQTPPVRASVAVRTERINALLGLQLTTAEIAAELAKLHIGAEAGSRGDELVVAVPWWRPDIKTEEDVAEEVVKLVGYDRLPATLPSWQPQAIEFDSVWEPRWRAKAALRSLGLFEVVTYSFISHNQLTALGRNPKSLLKLKNPLSSEQAYLRTDLLPSLLRVAERNRAYARRFGVYEFSKVYRARRAGELPDEPLQLGVLMRTEADGYRSVKATLDRLTRVFNVPVALQLGGVAAAEAHPARSAQLLVAGEVIGWIGQLHPNLAAQTKLGGELGYLELDWERFRAASHPQLHQTASRFPVVTRDLSIVVARTVGWQQLQEGLSGEAASFVSDYYGADLPASDKVVTLRLSLQAPDHTLTDAEADTRGAALVERLRQRYGAKLQS